jgi:transposase
MRGQRGKRLQRQRSEKVERTFAHVCETGGARRALLRGQEKVSKRYLIQVAARNLGLVMRKLFGMGTARSLQGLGGLFWALPLALGTLGSRWSADRIAVAIDFMFRGVGLMATNDLFLAAEKPTKSTGC